MALNGELGVPSIINFIYTSWLDKLIRSRRPKVAPAARGFVDPLFDGFMRGLMGLDDPAGG